MLQSRNGYSPGARRPATGDHKDLNRCVSNATGSPGAVRRRQLLRDKDGVDSGRTQRSHGRGLIGAPLRCVTQPDNRIGSQPFTRRGALCPKQDDQPVPRTAALACQSHVPDAEYRDVQAFRAGAPSLPDLAPPRALRSCSLTISDCAFAHVLLDQDGDNRSAPFLDVDPHHAQHISATRHDVQLAFDGTSRRWGRRGGRIKPLRDMLAWHFAQDA